MPKKKQLLRFGARVIGCTFKGLITGCFIWLLAGLVCLLLLGFEKAASVFAAASYSVPATTGIGTTVGVYVGWKRHREDRWDRIRER